MKHINNYNLFVESINEDYEEIMKNMAADIDVDKIEGADKELTTLKDNIEQKKVELEKQLENLEKLEVDAFTDENKETVEQKKEEIGESIEKLKEEIASFEESIKTLKDKTASLKEQ